MPVPRPKLVRDRIPDISQPQGRSPVTRVLDEASHRLALTDWSRGAGGEQREGRRSSR